MSPTSRLHDALSQFLSQCEIQWQDVRHLQTLCWMMVGIIPSQNVHLNGFGVYVNSRAKVAQSHQRRFRRWLANRRINVMSTHHLLMQQALSGWGNQRLDLSLDTTMLWNCFCIVWVGVVYPWTDSACGLEGGRSIQQHRALMDDSAGVAASLTGDAGWRERGVTG